jgi:glycosyltransferase involved in cell wall biosynthesis
MTEGDAVDLRRFTNLPSTEEAREEFGLTTDRKVVGYVGRLKTLGMEKGVKTLLEALARNKTWFGFIVGGPDGDKQEYEKVASELGLTADDVKFTGSVSARFVPSALAACDALAMPFPDLPHYRHHMSPLKMFEYMAANRTIVTTDLPTVRDVLSEDEAVFCAPDSAEALAGALSWIAEHPAEAQAKAQKALRLVMEHSWEERMRRVLDAAMLPAL